MNTLVIRCSNQLCSSTVYAVRDSRMRVSSEALAIMREWVEDESIASDSLYCPKCAELIKRKQSQNGNREE